MALAGGDKLWFVDPRTFGEWSSSTRRGPRSRCPSWHGSDLIAPRRAHGRDAPGRLRDRARPIKGVLLDQQAVAGLGNIYTDEVLHGPVRFDRPSGAADRGEVGAPRGHRLGARTAIAAGGSDPRRTQYVGLSPAGDLPGAAPGLRPGGASVPALRSTVVGPAHAGRSTFFCPRCQS
jgi:formamidopyrimidine-DNA glycosylase